MDTQREMVGEEPEFRGFPVLRQPTAITSTSPEVPSHRPALSQNKVPLTAQSTVTDADSGASVPLQPKPRSNLEHRNKGDPFLTRLIYGALSRLTGVPLEKGYSQVDWMRISRGTPTLRPRRDITLAEVKQHRSADDAWMVFRNRVYNITPYLKFHPGGADMLMKAAGRDGTSLFMKYHPWVNIDALMEKCLVGMLADEPGGAGPVVAGEAAVLGGSGAA